MKTVQTLQSFLSELSNSDIIAICAAFVSLLALGITIWQGLLTRRHNILSVKPFIDFERHVSQKGNILFIIRNNGIGTAIITSATIENHGHSREFKPESLGEFAKNYPISWAGGHITHIDPPTALSSGASFSMIEIEQIENNEDFKNTIRLLRDSTIHIEYECMYGKKHKAFSTCA
ncbi:hypothetical protein ACIGKM_16135 [Ectopseudomonas toyotomiensis]|uniref:hypothetical protein n=1 Tax=Ectopseudomonas toyotomiensis TaxID=554344 RepID=UPI0037CB187A